MRVSQISDDDVEAVIIAAEENPEYRDEIIQPSEGAPIFQRLLPPDMQ